MAPVRHDAIARTHVTEEDMVVDRTLHEIARCTARQAVLQAVLPLGAVDAVDAHEPIQRAVAK